LNLLAEHRIDCNLNLLIKLSLFLHCNFFTHFLLDPQLFLEPEFNGVFDWSDDELEMMVDCGLDIFDSPVEDALVFHHFFSSDSIKVADFVEVCLHVSLLLVGLFFYKFFSDR